MQLNSYAQESTNQNLGLDNPVNYSATDSIVADIPNQIIRLYGDANVTYDDVILNSEIIEIDLNKSEISAFYGIDSTGEKFGRPEFTQGGELIKCDRIKYNFEQKKVISLKFEPNTVKAISTWLNLKYILIKKFI